VDPARALEAIGAAQSELVIMSDLIRNVENMRTLSVQYVDTALSEQEKLIATAAAVERRKCELKTAGSRLKAVAKQMRAEVEQDRVFIQSLSDLQVLARAISTCSVPTAPDHRQLVDCRPSGGSGQLQCTERPSFTLRWCSQSAWHQ
jgi:hypothetical protein